VGWIRRRGRDRPGTLRSSDSTDLAHLNAFMSSQRGVEAYLEPRTTVTDTTVVLVASSGEWTRRRIDGADGARSFAKKHAIPLYDVAVVGYPQRMRDWTAKRKTEGS
jgi:hypothetical protein